MAIAYVGASSGEEGTATNFLVAAPTGVQVGHTVVVAVESNNLHSFPAGWVADSNQTPADPKTRQTIYWKVMTSGDIAAFPLSIYTGGDDVAWVAAAFSGVEVVSAISSWSWSSTTEVFTPAVDVAKQGSWVVGVIGGNRPTLPTLPSGYTSRVTALRTSFAYRAVRLGDQQADPPQYGGGSATVESADWVGHSVILRPANVAPNAPILTAPADGSTIDRNITQRFTLDPSDPDPGDSTSETHWRYRPTPKNETQTVTITGGPTGGSFTLTYDGQTTAAIAFDATAAAVQTALEGLTNIGVGDVACTGGPLPGIAVTVEFTGALGNTNVAQMTAASSLTGGTSPAVTVATTQQGVAAGAWTTAVKVSPNTFYDFAAGTFLGDDYEWQAATKDAAGEPVNDADLVWSASSFFTADDPPNQPTWTDPINGQTIATEDYTGTISAPDVDESEFRLVADNAGVIDETTVLQGPVVKATGDLRSHTFTGLANGVTVWWQARTKFAGLWSQWAAVRTPVSYTPPAAPTVTLSDDDESGSLWVNITNPTPGAGEPTAEYNSVEVDDGDGWERRATFLATNTGWRYWTPISGRDYSGNVRVTAHGSNGTTTTTTVPAGTAPVEGFYYGGGY